MEGGREREKGRMYSVGSNRKQDIIITIEVLARNRETITRNRLGSQSL